ncbi:MAG: fumarylacetoacetate hydrolase family protein [Bacteroidota bacterium]
MIIDHKQLGRKLDIAALEREAIPQLTLDYQISVDDAYEIQFESIARRKGRSEKVIGIKMGFTSKAKMKQMGVNDLIWGILTDKMKVKTGGYIEIGNFIHPRAEPELCFLVSKNIDRELRMDEIGDYIEAVAPAIEIIDSRYQNFKFALEDVIADNCSSSAFVVGQWENITKTIENLEVELFFDGEVVQKGNTNDILGNPFQSIIEASRLTSKYNFTIKKNSYIMAGAATPASYLKKKSLVKARIQHLGDVDLNIV